MENQETLPEIKKIESVMELAAKHLPRLITANQKAVARMKEIVSIETPDNYEDAEALLGAVKTTYDVMYGLRTEITKPLDELKKYFMSFERPLSDDKDSEYTRVRNEMVAFKQRELDKKKKIEAEAAKKREKENHIVDIRTAILKNLNDMITQKTKDAYTKSADYFAATDLSNFDERADKFMKMKPNLKENDYLSCFSFQFNPDLLTKDEFHAIVGEMSKVESYNKWSEELITHATPVVNTWRSQIPEIKKQLQDLEKVKSDKEAHDKLLLDQKRAAQAEEARQKALLDKQAEEKANELNAQAGIDKMTNSFVEQVEVQSAGDTGPVKYILKFTDPKKTLTALTTIIYHCMASPEFPGIQKRDSKTKALVTDSEGRPEYIEPVQWWINFFLSKCDGAVDGTVLHEVSKIQIRK